MKVYLSFSPLPTYLKCFCIVLSLISPVYAQANHDIDRPWSVQIGLTTHPQSQDHIHTSWIQGGFGPRFGYRWNRLTPLIGFDYQGSTQTDKLQGDFSKGIFTVGLGLKIHLNPIQSPSSYSALSSDSSSSKSLTSSFDSFLTLFAFKPFSLQNTNQSPSSTSNSSLASMAHPYESGLGFQVGFGTLFRPYSAFACGFEVGYNGSRFILSHSIQQKTIQYDHQSYSRLLFEVYF